MKNRRGTVGRITGIAEGVAAAARRRQRGRAPRVLLYDERGHPRLVPTDAPAFEDLVAAGGRMSELWETRAEPAAGAKQGSRPSTDGVSVPDPQVGKGNDTERKRRNA